MVLSTILEDAARQPAAKVAIAIQDRGLTAVTTGVYLGFEKVLVYQKMDWLLLKLDRSNLLLAVS